MDINYDKFCPFYKSVWMVIHFYNLANQAVERAAGVDGRSELRRLLSLSSNIAWRSFLPLSVSK
ncbi:unnamed protein product, partial [Arabidopsis halleri]